MLVRGACETSCGSARQQIQSTDGESSVLPNISDAFKVEMPSTQAFANPKWYYFGTPKPANCNARTNGDAGGDGGGGTSMLTVLGGWVVEPKATAALVLALRRK